MRGYWKFNNSLLKDTLFNDAIKNLVEETLNDDDLNNNCRKKWKFKFKYKVRFIAIKEVKN